jgi:hypothetical protein
MRNQQHRQIRVASQRTQQIQILRLQGHIQRGSGLVATSNLGRPARAIAIIARCCMPPSTHADRIAPPDPGPTSPPAEAAVHFPRIPSPRMQAQRFGGICPPIMKTGFNELPGS